MGPELRRVGAMAWKDLTAERRTRANLNAVLFFAGLMLLLFGFALGPDAEALRRAGAGIGRQGGSRHAPDAVTR